MLVGRRGPKPKPADPPQGHARAECDRCGSELFWNGHDIARTRYEPIGFHQDERFRYGICAVCGQETLLDRD